MNNEHNPPLPCDPCPLQQELDALKKQIAELSKLVNTDTLTDLYNFRHFYETLNHELERSVRTGIPTALIMLDADHFKRVNDEWGHENGNKALVHLATIVKHSIRKLDIPCRYGGEEFAVILPSTDILTASMIAERIRMSVEDSELFVKKDAKKHRIHLTISLGVACSSGNGNNPSAQLIEAADEELYRAKQSGRNTVCSKVEESKEHSMSIDEKSALEAAFRANRSKPTESE